MPRLPHCERAILEIRKIEDYCLNAAHARGRHKARVFSAALGIDRRHSAWFREAVLEAIGETDAIELGYDKFGTRWHVDVRLTRQDKSAVIRTLWIVRSEEAAPRFVTCWIL